MDRILTTEERIKRAQEIYERRRNDNARYNTTVVNVNEKKNYKLLKKVFIQMLICFGIYYAFYNITNKQYPFSENTINKTKEILSYDMNFYNMYNNIKNLITNNSNEEMIQENSQEQIVSPEETAKNTLEEATLSATDIAEENEDLENVVVDQMQIDANYIKQKLELIKPVEGTVSSEYGIREVSSSIVSNNHAGIDIAANEGTKIVSAMDGTVSISKKSSSYRKLHKNSAR